ncbi:MAG: hypothetical protein JNJ50_05850 [Acidobacteria bacterium]|jgi:hypothetical protein|nr:hypothetical protein [Acidobacteriota bacterium]
MKHPNAVSLAKRLLSTRIKRQPLTGIESDMPHQITDEEIAWALDILATHLDACMKQGIHPDLSEAVEDALDFAFRHETAYEPIPLGVRWHSALVVLNERDAD